MKSNKRRCERKIGRSNRSDQRRGPTPRRGRRAAFETLEDRRLLAIVVNTAVDELDGSIADGDISLRDAIAAAPAGETINFNAALNGATMSLTLGELQIARSLTIDTVGLVAGLTID